MATGATSENGCGCGCGCGGKCGGACACTPAEFARLRYYFGQRLGAVDFLDEQAYHAGKHRFHNLRCHGPGVLCGLKAERFVFPQGSPPATPTTILRVTAGAALDACGREVLVPNDQCVDVNAWFLANQKLPGVVAWLGAGSGTLRVALRYRDCPTDPAPAPRDPCGCGSTGWEFGRVRESFELALLTDTDADVCIDGAFPASSGLLHALDGLGRTGLAGGALDRLRRRLGSLVAAECPAPGADRWVCLATFRVTLAGTPTEVVNLTHVDNHAPGRRTLLSTGALQSLVEGLAAAAAGEALGTGPRFGEGSFQGSGADAGTVLLPIHLVTAGPAGTPVPLANDPAFVASNVKVHFLDGSGRWQDATPAGPAGAVNYEPGPPAQVRLRWDSGLQEQVNYRLTVAPPFETPIVDADLRPLAPGRLARTFRLALDAATNTLKLDTSNP